jgi:hypothetical protein
LAGGAGEEKVTTSEEKKKALEDLADVQLWLGRAISDFSRVEKAMGEVYKSCYTIDNWALAMNCYLAISDAGLRQKLTSRAVYVTIYANDGDDDLAAEWSKLSGDLRRLSERRNELAHGEVKATKELGTSGGYEVYALPFAHEEPYTSVSRKHLTKAAKNGGLAPSGVFAVPKRRWSLVEIQEFTVDCQSSRARLRDFGHKIEALLSPK